MNKLQDSPLYALSQNHEHCVIYSSPLHEYRLYVIKLPENKVRIGVLTPRRDEISFVLHRPHILKRFCEDVIKLLA